MNRNTVNRYYNLLRVAILSESVREAKREVGEYELDESYFGARRVRGKSHVNGIENFWSFAKRRLAKFNGCNSDKFVPRLKECALATKFQAVAVQPQARGLASTRQEVVQ